MLIAELACVKGRQTVNVKKFHRERKVKDKHCEIIDDKIVRLLLRRSRRGTINSAV